MVDTESDKEALEASLEELEEKVERLEEQGTGKNTLRLKSHDIEVQATSENCNLEEMADILSVEMEEMARRALVGEYQELEEQGLHHHIFGGD